jgi:dipeptidyl aminopeptidase/acylaminoacyl peptidase
MLAEHRSKHPEAYSTMQQPVYLNSQNQLVVATLHYPDSSESPFPAVLLCHGFSGHRIETRRLFVRFSRYLSEQGIASLRFDYRGSGESAGDFQNFTVRDYIRDGHAALRALTHDVRINAQRIGILGFSLGGCVAAYLASEHPGTKALALWAPVAEPLETFRRNVEHFPDLTQYKDDDYLEHNGIPVGVRFLKQLGELRPVEKLAATCIPVLLCHGAADETVLPESTELFYAALAKESRDVEKLYLRDAAHNFTSLTTDLELFQKTAQWFVKHLCRGH